MPTLSGLSSVFVLALGKDGRSFPFDDAAVVDARVRHGGGEVRVRCLSRHERRQVIRGAASAAAVGDCDTGSPLVSFTGFGGRGRGNNIGLGDSRKKDGAYDGGGEEEEAG